ncbi:MAG: hypothetical protein K0S56_518 [Microvirga sp.]|jgi:hypothetical protein|nr:hypothetical protein [Microvirga sp.]
MSPLLIPVITGAIELVLGKIKNGENVEVKDVIDAVTPQAKALEQTITDAAKETWLADLHNGGWMATSWRPLAAVTSIAGLAWEGFLLPIVNTIVAVPYPPEYVSQAFLYTLLTLIGARGIEKINIARRR